MKEFWAIANLALIIWGATMCWRSYRDWRHFKRAMWFGELADRELMLAKKYLALGDELKAITHAMESRRLHDQWLEEIQR